ncbi:MAG TPA: prepilin-type N-terminal cleavage/methylation domain-containing protein [Polyangiaceae bacterium]|nr:prepilin-type N-terminal cleavage/methylation domain-containing protein [Polyangiaceae bacterium]
MRAVPAQYRRRARGFTLIEMLVVVALVAALVGTVLLGAGAFTGARLRAAAAMIMNGVRIGINRANLTGHATRMVFDLDAKTVTLEETSGRMLIEKKSDSEPSAGAEGPNQVEQDAVKSAQLILDGPHAPRARFSPVAAFVGEKGNQSGRELGKGVRYLAVQTEHDSEPRVDGKAYLYFWPGGSTERAVIQLAPTGETEGISVVVSGLTGRAHVEHGLSELSPILDGNGPNEEFGVREEK